MKPVLRLADGGVDDDTLTALVRLHQAGLYRFARYLGADAETAEDMVQETFLTACEHDSAIPAEVGQCGAWLRGILRNLFFAHLRREKRQTLLHNAEALRQAEAHWQAEALARDEDASAYVAALRQCLQQTNDRDRELLRLRYEDNLALEEIGNRFNLGAEGVKTALRRLRVRLAECVRRRLRQADI